MHLILKEDEELKSIKFKGNKVPDRLYTCNFYTVKNAKSKYSLDIAKLLLHHIIQKTYTLGTRIPWGRL